MPGIRYHRAMLTLPQMLSFLLAAVVLTATPGPDNLMVLSVGMSKGRRRGMAFGLGCAAGCISHTVLAVLGISALLAASELAFTALKWIGGGYLVWLGVQAWRHAGTGVIQGEPAGSDAPHTLFFKGMLANAINPKVVLFFLSFLPQFVVPAQGPVGLQIGVLGALFAAQAAVLFGLIGYFSGEMGVWLTQRPRAAVWLDRAAGTVFVGLGLRIVASR
jgi:threonine/homoserine/homoserine lactone efflux protein